MPRSDFLRKPSNEYVLNGWRYRMAVSFSTQNRSYFGPAIGHGRLVNVTADDMTVDFEAVILRASEYQKGFGPNFPAMKPLAAYEKALDEAVHEINHKRVELNRVLDEAIAGRRVRKNWSHWNDLDRAAGFSVVSSSDFQQPVHLLAAE